MQPLIDDARTFGQRSEEFARLAEGHSPQVLFITCSKSQVAPALITGARRRELFQLCTTGNIVPPHACAHPTSEAATIEYAVEVFGVRDIVVCGHPHYGAVGALVRGDDLTTVPAVRDWLTHLTPRPAGAAEGPEVADGVQSHVLAQLLRLRSYPCVERKPVAGGPTLHAGTVRTHRPQTDTFEAL